MIDLYAAGTSNGMRARIALEECGLPYKLNFIDLAKGEHKTAQFLALNPNGQNFLGTDFLTNFDTIDLNAATAQFSADPSVPEPSSLILAGLGLAFGVGYGACRRGGRNVACQRRANHRYSGSCQ